jgi:hypothetical protein
VLPVPIAIPKALVHRCGDVDATEQAATLRRRIGRGTQPAQHLSHLGSEGRIGEGLSAEANRQR